MIQHEPPEPCASWEHDWRVEPLGGGRAGALCMTCGDVSPWIDCLQHPDWIEDHGRTEQCNACMGCTERDREARGLLEEMSGTPTNGRGLWLALMEGGSR